MTEIAGLKLIVPSSVAGSGVSVSASGKVTFTAATEIAVNGCFSATYDNYLIVVKTSGAGGNSFFNYRASGVNATGNYTQQYIYADNTTVGAARQSQTNVAIISESSDTGGSGSHIYLYGPFLSQPSAGRTVQVAGINGSWIEDRAHTHSVSSSYDGFRFYTNSGSHTGALTIYGLSQ